MWLMTGQMIGLYPVGLLIIERSGRMKSNRIDLETTEPLSQELTVVGSLV
jgi:hypothetical protein